MNLHLNKKKFTVAAGIYWGHWSTAAVIFIIICLLVGLVLGQRFKVLVLVPAIALVGVFSIAVGVTRADAYWPIVFMAVVATVCLQIGYLLGIGVRSLLVGVRANRVHVARLGASSPTRRPAL